VPSSWEWTTIASFSYDLLYGTSEKSSYEGHVPVLRMGNITCTGSIDYSDLVYSSNEEDIKKYKLEKDDLLFNRTNSSEWVGKTAIFKIEEPTIYAGYLIRVRCILVDPDYINFVMNSSYHREWCNQVKTDAVNQSNINAQKLSNFSIPIPPLYEQHRIVAEIERWFTLIDLIEQDKADLQTTIKQAKSKILDLAIHGKLVPQDSNDEPASELLKRINPKAEITCDNGHYQNLPFEVPQNWSWTTLGKIGRWQSGSTPSRLNRDYYNGSIPWLKTGDLNDGYITHIPEYITEKALNETSVKLNPAGSVLIAMYGATIGKIGILTYPATTNQACCACKTFNGIDNEFLFFFLLSHRDEFIKMGGGGAQPNISKEKIINTYIPLPPFVEQKRIVSAVRKAFILLDAIMESL
jgi:type I restriction enzyme S subunit